MLALRRIFSIVSACSLMTASLQAKETREAVSLTLEQFTNLALRNSLRSRTAEETLASNRSAWLASRRSLTWPTLSASAAEQKTHADDDVNTKTDTQAGTASLAINQPMLTGTQLSLGSTWTRSRTETETLGAVTPSMTKYVPAWNAGVTQPLFVFTGNESLRNRRAANLRWDDDQDSYWTERLNIEFDARTQYYDLLLQSETMAVQRRKLESARLVNDTTRALVRAGKLAEVELVRADIRSRQDERSIQNAENNLEQSMNRAKDLISLPTDQRIELASKLSYESFRIPLEKLSRAALENNPALQTAKRAVELAEIEYKRTRETNLPNVNTSGTYSVTRDRSNDAVPVDPTQWTMKVGMEWAIFDAGQTRLRKRQSEISLQNAKRSFDNQRRQLLVSVENALLEVKRAEEQISDFGPQRQSAERNVQAIRLQYKNGLTRLTDVFDAENQMLNLDLEYLGLLVAFNTARDRLKVLIGNDLSEIDQRKGQ